MIALVAASRRTVCNRGCYRGWRAASSAVEPMWQFEFQTKENALLAQYGLPDELPGPAEAIAGFFPPLIARIRSGPTRLLDTSSRESISNAVASLAFLSELRRKSEQLVDEQRAMEAINLFTTRWHIVAADGHPLFRLSARRALRDRLPAVAAVGMGLLGPIAWLPGVLGINEVIMRRADNYGAIQKSTPSGVDFSKAVFKHHVARSIYDAPRVLKLDEFYDVASNLSDEELKDAIARGSFEEVVSGSANL